MSKFNYKSGGAEVMSAGITAGTAFAGMIGANQLLDFTKIFKTKYAADPEGFMFKHQGAIKAGLGVSSIFLYSAITNKKMHPALKGLLIGLIIQGAFQEARVLTTGADGNSPLEQLGRGEGADLSDLNELMRKASMSGDPGQYNQTTGIGQSEQSVDLMQNASSGIGFAWDYLPQGQGF